MNANKLLCEQNSNVGSARYQAEDTPIIYNIINKYLALAEPQLITLIKRMHIDR